MKYDLIKNSNAPSQEDEKARDTIWGATNIAQSVLKYVASFTHVDPQLTKFLLGKFGGVVSLSITLDKYGKGEDTGNARVDDGELLSLEEAGVAAINTQYQNSRLTDKQGNAYRQTGTMTMQDGAVHDTADVWFAAYMGYTRYTTGGDIPCSICQLPYICGNVVV